MSFMVHRLPPLVLEHKHRLRRINVRILRSRDGLGDAAVTDNITALLLAAPMEWVWRLWWHIYVYEVEPPVGTTAHPASLTHLARTVYNNVAQRRTIQPPYFFTLSYVKTGGTVHTLRQVLHSNGGPGGSDRADNETPARDAPRGSAAPSIVETVDQFYREAAKYTQYHNQLGPLRKKALSFFQELISGIIALVLFSASYAKWGKRRPGRVAWSNLHPLITGWLLSMGRDLRERNTSPMEGVVAHRITFSVPLSTKIQHQPKHLVGPQTKEWFLTGAEVGRLMAQARIYYGVKGNRSAVLTDTWVFV